jgi:hypothetical protein
MNADPAPFARRTGRRLGAGLVVVGLHLAGLLAWWTQGYEMRLAEKPVQLVPIAIWLPPLSVPFTEREKALVPKKTVAPERTHSGASALPSATAATQTKTADDAVVHAPGDQGAVALAPAASAPALDLTLSRKALTALAPRSFADKSPFHGRLPATVEQQVSLAFSERGPWTEERVDINHIRFRRGNTCIMMERSQAAQLFPFEESASRIPWRAGEPKPCQ